MAASEHHPEGMWVFPAPEAVTGDMAEKAAGMPKAIARALIVTGILFGLGIAGFVVRALEDGFRGSRPVGLLRRHIHVPVHGHRGRSTGCGGFPVYQEPLASGPSPAYLSCSLLLGVLNVIMFIPLMIVLPSIKNPEVGVEELEIRRSIWFETPIGAPLAWDFLGILFLAICSLAILWLSAMPDMAEGRLAATGFRRRLYSLLAGRWYGTKRQWTIAKSGPGSAGRVLLHDCWSSCSSPWPAIMP